MGRFIGIEYEEDEEFPIVSDFERKLEGENAREEGERADIPFKSAPVQKARPEPIMTAQRSVGSLSYHFHRASSSWLLTVSMQLRSAGRLRVTRRMLGVGKVMRERETVGGGDENEGFDMMCLPFVVLDL